MIGNAVLQRNAYPVRMANRGFLAQDVVVHGFSTPSGSDSLITGLCHRDCKGVSRAINKLSGHRIRKFLQRLLVASHDVLAGIKAVQNLDARFVVGSQFNRANAQSGLCLRQNCIVTVMIEDCVDWHLKNIRAIIDGNVGNHGGAQWE